MKRLKYKKIVIGAFAFVFLFASGCKKDFLDVPVDSQITQDRINELLATNPAAAARLVESSLSGVYNTMVDNGLNGNTQHDYFGLKAIHLALDLTGEDMVQVRHHHFGFDYNIDNREAGFRRTSLMWSLFYRIISSSNLTLDQFFKEEPEDAVLKSLKASALGLRGIAYYYLINAYQQTYKGNENSLGVPLVLSPLDENMPRAKVSEVYDQIIQDLTYSVENGVETAVKTDVDKRVAAAYLAKVYASMEVWDKVEEYAKIAYTGVSLLDGNTLLNGLGDISSTEWLWGYDINAQTTGLYASFYAHADNTINGYTGALEIYKSIHNKLYEKIAEDDTRKKMFTNLTLFPEIASTYGLTENYIGLKYKTPGDFSGDYCFIRAEDPLLLYIEALIEQNKLDLARTELSNFVKTRQPSYDADVFVSQEQLRNEIRLQRRIELWCEGTSFFDLKRWKLGISRQVTGTNHRVILSFPAGDKVFVYQIPQQEVDANTNLGGQNP